MKLEWKDNIIRGEHVAIQGGLQARVWEAAGAWHWGIWARPHTGFSGAGKIAEWDSMPEAPLKPDGAKDGLVPALGEAPTREIAIATCEYAMDTAAVCSMRGRDY